MWNDFETEKLSVVYFPHETKIKRCWFLNLWTNTEHTVGKRIETRAAQPFKLTNQLTNTHIHKSEACVYIDWNSPKPKSSRQAAMWVYEIHSALRCVCIMCIVGRSLIHSPIHSLCLSLPWISYMLIIYIVGND